MKQIRISIFRGRSLLWEPESRGWWTDVYRFEQAASQEAQIQFEVQTYWIRIQGDNFFKSEKRL